MDVDWDADVELRLMDWKWKIFIPKWLLFDELLELSGVVFYLGGVLQSTSEGYRETLGQPWVPKGDFEAI